MIERPMLAHRKNPILKALKYPKLVSAKLDGIRAIRPRGDVRLHTRKLKLVPNINVRELFTHKVLECCDGELIVGEPNAPDVYSKTESVVMSYAPPKAANHVRLFLFDYFGETEYDYERRLSIVKDMVHLIGSKAPIVLVEQQIARSEDDVMEIEDHLVRLGYEGVMIRDPRAPYKHGRATLKEEFLLKLKRFEDGEAYITGFEEQQQNTNEATTSELGYKKRSKKQEGMVGKGTCGVIIGYDDMRKWEVRVGMGSGLTDEVRAWLWKHRHQLLKKRTWFKYRWTPAGTQDLPRSPRWMGLRDRKDF